MPLSDLLQTVTNMIFNLLSSRLLKGGRGSSSCINKKYGRIGHSLRFYRFFLTFLFTVTLLQTTTLNQSKYATSVRYRDVTAFKKPPFV